MRGRDDTTALEPDREIGEDDHSMEELVILGLLAVAFVLAVSAIFGVLAYSKLRGLESRLTHLERMLGAQHATFAPPPARPGDSNRSAALHPGSSNEASRGFSPSSDTAHDSSARGDGARESALRGDVSGPGFPRGDTAREEAPRGDTARDATPRGDALAGTSAPGAGDGGRPMHETADVARHSAASVPSLPPAFAPASMTPSVAGPWSSAASSRGPSSATVPPSPGASATDVAASPAGGLPPVAPAKSSSGIEWERWLGVRGAAVLGGVVVAIAGLLFLKHSIEAGWFSPRLRVTLAGIAGVVGFVASVPLRRRGYTIVADSVAGAGAVISFGSAWAAHVLYGFVGFEIAFAWMVATTIACLWLAHRHTSLVIAVLGLVGGFATPILLSSGSDRPVSLFTYVLLLDLAFLFLAGKRRWPSLGLVALVGTFVVQGLWILGRMTPESTSIGLVVLAVFALVFAVFASRVRSEDRRRFGPTQVGALLLPFGFALFVAHDADLSLHLAPTMALALLLTLAAAWTARTSGMAWLPFGSASGSVALAFTWAVSREDELTRRHLIELAVCAGVLLAVNALLLEWARVRAARRERVEGGESVATGARPPAPQGGEATFASHDAPRDATALGAPSATRAASIEHAQRVSTPHEVEVASGARDAAVACALGFSILAAWLASRPVDAGPRALVLLGLGAVLVVFRAVARGSHAASAIGATTLLGLQLVAWSASHTRGPFVPRSWVWCAAVVAMGGVVLAGVWLARRRAPPWLALATVTYAVPALFAGVLLGSAQYRAAWPVFVGAGFVVAIQIAFAATITARTAWGSVLFGAAVATAWCVASSGFDEGGHAAHPRFFALFAANVAVVLALTAWPLVRRDLWAGRAQAWRTAALVPLAWFVHLHDPFVARFGDRLVFVLPLSLAALSAACAWRAHAVRGDEDRARRVGRIWYSAGAVLFAAMIVPQQVGRDVLSTTLALFALGLAWLRVRLAVDALAWVSAAAAVGATAVLCGVRAWKWFPRSDVRVVNDLAWIYLVPAVAVVTTAVWLRRRPAISTLGSSGVSAGAAPLVPPVVAGVCAVLLGFAWLNLEIANAFAEGAIFAWRYEQGPARNLTVSIAWATYALAILVVGVVARRSGPRWASLVLILLTIGKVFLSDLGHLSGLYRAASVLGLGLSLLVVSVLYQKFVFRRARAGEGS